MLVPELGTYAVTPYDRRCTRNINRIKTIFIAMLDEHRKEHKSGKPIEREWDFLDMMIHDNYFKDQDHEIIDEAVTFFFAGMVTLKVATCNMLIHLVRLPELKAKLIAEVDQITSKYKDSKDFVEKYDMETADEFEYLRHCFYESMRIEAPTMFTTSNCFNEDVTIDGITIKAGQGFYVNLDAIHHNSEEWHTPELFIPERFNSESKYFKRPDGKPRNPLSFVPFTSGKRICIGKTFAEQVVRYTSVLLLYHFDLEYADPADMHKPKPGNNALLPKAPAYMVNLIQRR